MDLLRELLLIAPVIAEQRDVREARLCDGLQRRVDGLVRLEAEHPLELLSQHDHVLVEGEQGLAIPRAQWRRGGSSGVPKGVSFWNAGISLS